ncbi:MAG: tetratricopeptide repeat protein [Burkholderiaceae bacterium]|nr:tetratricopeptide repeat protein [Burkholderiaceae bacterium]
MREDLEQQEQLAAIKGFWSDNKKWITPLLALALIAATAFNGWNWWQNRQAVNAAQALTAMEGALAEQSLDKARAAYKALATDYSGSTQAALGGLQIAKALAAAGELAEARTVLAQVADKGAEEFAWMARIRMAGVMLDENNAKGALEALSGKPPKPFAPLVDDRKGDAHAALGNKQDARSAWKAAAEGLPAQSPSRELILRKLQTIDSFAGAKP